jgi:hypothetical protein
MSVVDTLAAHPALVVVLAAVMRAALAWQRELSWPEYRLLHAAKRLTFPRLDAVSPGGFDSFVNDKGGREDAEFITTAAGDLQTTVQALRDGGGSLHLVSSVKRRPDEHGDPLSAAHVVWNHGTDQTEAYLFRNADGTVDIYSHFEASPETPLEHLDGNQQDGDPRRVVRGALDR